MNLEKAIEILSEAAYHGTYATDPDTRDAMKMGVASLIMIRTTVESGRDPVQAITAFLEQFGLSF